MQTEFIRDQIVHVLSKSFTAESHLYDERQTLSI